MGPSSTGGLKPRPNLCIYSIVYDVFFLLCLSGETKDSANHINFGKIYEKSIKSKDCWDMMFAIVQVILLRRRSGVEWYTSMVIG